MSSDESRVQSWGNQQEESVPSTSSSSSGCRENFTPVPIFVAKPITLARPGEMGRDRVDEEVGSPMGSEGNNQLEWGAGSSRSVVTGDMLASWRAKYDIPSSVIMIILEPSDHADAPLWDVSH